MTFSADAVVENSNPFWGDLVGNVVDTYGFTIGSTAGNKIWIHGNFQYETVKYADQDGVMTYDCTANLCSSDASTNDDEITMVFA